MHQKNSYIPMHLRKNIREDLIVNPPQLCFKHCFYRMVLIFRGCFFREFGGVREIISTKFLRLRPPKSIITRAPRSRAFSVSERERVKHR